MGLSRKLEREKGSSFILRNPHNDELGVGLIRSGFNPPTKGYRQLTAT
jgi:hypothetical protein